MGSREPRCYRKDLQTVSTGQLVKRKQMFYDIVREDNGEFGL